ncbi:MAG: hypothetical protein AAF411_32230, partial [Myxococcota bacterium]
MRILPLLVGLLLARSAHADEGAFDLDPPTLEAPPEESPPSPFHVDIDAGWQRLSIRYVVPLALAVPDCECGLQPLRVDLMRLSGSIGWGGISLEGSVAKPLRSSLSLFVWTAGIRLDTSYRAPLSLGIRIAYLRRRGDAEATGGRASAALQLRPTRKLVLYAEAGAEGTNVPG